MHQFRCSFILLCAILSTPSHAEDVNFCKSICTSDKSACRGIAQELTRTDTDPIFVMERKNSPLAVVGDNRMGRSEEVQGMEVSKFRNRRMERYHACDDKFMHCAHDCSNQKPATNSSVILTRPETTR